MARGAAWLGGLALAIATLDATPATAQRVAGQPGAPGAPGAQGVPAAVAGPPIERLAAVVQRRLNLTDEQGARLRQVTGKLATQRQELLRQEREARRALRAQMAAGTGADQQNVARLLDELVRVQQRRVELVATEQRELATFLTPLQRAEFLAMQERAFRAAQQLRQRRAAGGGGSPFGARP